MKTNDVFGTLQEFSIKNNQKGNFYALQQLEKNGVANVSRLPMTIRIILESLLRNFDNNKITKDHILKLANWLPNAQDRYEVPFMVSRILLQDYTGIPLLTDLAALRNAISKLGYDPYIVEPHVPVCLVVDHSVQTKHIKSADALKLNMIDEFSRNKERYEFIKWSESNFKKLQVIPPGMGIVHQINLEYLAKGILKKDRIYYPDSVIGTDSHTTMINGLGIIGWGAGGIEAELGMLGEPIYISSPDVIGIHLHGKLDDGVTATDLVLNITEILRKRNVVGKIVEYFGSGLRYLSAPDRATIANMAPDYGAKMGFFPTDEATLQYFSDTGRSKKQVDTIYSYLVAQNLFGNPRIGQIDYSDILEINLNSIKPVVAGPKRPQDKINLFELKSHFKKTLARPENEGGYNKPEVERDKLYRVGKKNVNLKHGDILIAGITSCTNTSNPNLLLTAGLLAKKAIEHGLSVKPHILTSLTPGSRIVGTYLKKSGLQQYLDKLGFQLAAFGCATCVGNVGNLDADVERTVKENDIIVTSVLSGNRNFEARIHPSIKANYLASPPLVVAFAIAGNINIDFGKEPLGINHVGKAIYLRDIWPSSEEVSNFVKYTIIPKKYKSNYSNYKNNNPLWNKLPTRLKPVYDWDPTSTYIAEPPFLERFTLELPKMVDIRNAKALLLLGNSITTDHISPAGTIPPNSPAAKYLLSKGEDSSNLNSFGARRGHYEVMQRGAFCNVFLKNKMIPNKLGGNTIYQSTKEIMPIYEAAARYAKEKVPCLIFAGTEYGTGSSRDWASKCTSLLGVRAVIAESFEHIHKSNLVGMGILPCQFSKGDSIESLNITGEEEFDVLGIEETLQINKELMLIIRRLSGQEDRVKLTLRIDNKMELEYFMNGGILPYILRNSIKKCRREK